MRSIGFIGLGIMGRPMALNLLKALNKDDTRLMVNDVNPEAVRALTDAGATFGTPREIGAECDVIFTILPNGGVVQQVLFGEDGVASAIKPGSLVVDMSSVTATESQVCARRLAEKGVGFLDAPVSGGEPKAVDGTLAFMVGGTPEDFARAKPFFDAMGASALLVGESGSGSIAKLTNQIIVNLNIAALAEGFVLAAKAGVNPVNVYNAIRGGLAGSAVLDAKLPMIVRRDFKPGGKISINHKDIKNVLATAHTLDVPLPLTSALFEIMQALKVAGHMDDDHGGIVQYFERLADTEVREG